MNRNSLQQRQFCAGLMEILSDSKFYYHSTVGRDFSKLSEEGKAEIVKYIDFMAPMLIEERKKMLDEHAKEMVINGLSK